jgi:DNA-binding NtrC family response regulator
MSFPFIVSLIHHDFPLNVRELASLMQRAAALCEGAELLPEHLPEELQENMRDYARRGHVERPARPPRAPAAATSAPAATPGAPASAPGDPSAAASAPSAAASAPAAPDAPSAASAPSAPADPGEMSGAPIEEDLRALFRLHHGNLSAVSRELGKSRMQIHRWARRYGILIEDYR